MGFRYVNRLTPADVGRRVTIRRWVDDPDHGRIVSDVVGELRSWSEEAILTVLTRRGELVEVDERAIVAARVVGEPRRPPRSGPTTERA